MQYRTNSFAALGLGPLSAIAPDVVPIYILPEPDIMHSERVCEIYNQQCPDVCGNGIVEPANGEECDDGNDHYTDSCFNSCKKNVVTVCGNGIVEPGEECDDGNSISNDGCSSTCQMEVLCTSCNPTSCNPIPYPGSNRCDITTFCITNYPSGQTQCACRAGFKANALDSQFQLHYRLPFPGQEYRVFVKPGIACDTICDTPTGAPNAICTEVPVMTQCDVRFVRIRGL